MAYTNRMFRVFDLNTGKVQGALPGNLGGGCADHMQGWREAVFSNRAGRPKPTRGPMAGCPHVHRGSVGHASDSFALSNGR